MIESSNPVKCPLTRFYLSNIVDGNLFSSLQDGLFKIDSKGMISLDFERLNREMQHTYEFCIVAETTAGKRGYLPVELRRMKIDEFIKGKDAENEHDKKKKNNTEIGAT